MHLLYFLLHPMLFTPDKFVNYIVSCCKCYISEVIHITWCWQYNMFMLNSTCQNWAGKLCAHPCCWYSSVQQCIPAAWAAPLDAATFRFSVCSALLSWLALSCVVVGVTCVHVYGHWVCFLWRFCVVCECYRPLCSY